MLSRPDLLARKATAFALWRPDPSVPPPRLIIDRFEAGNPPRLVDRQELELRPSADARDVWERRASDCNLRDDVVYHY